MNCFYGLTNFINGRNCDFKANILENEKEYLIIIPNYGLTKENFSIIYQDEILEITISFDQPNVNLDMVETKHELSSIQKRKFYLPNGHVNSSVAKMEGIYLFITLGKKDTSICEVKIN